MQRCIAALQRSKITTLHFCVPLLGGNRKVRCLGNHFSIFVEGHSIDEHEFTFAHVMDVDWHADFDSRPNGILIEGFTALVT